MPCNYPNRIFYTGKLNPESGKRETIFTSSLTDYFVKRPGQDHWVAGHDLNDSLIEKMKCQGYKFLLDYDDIPCGQCIGCRLDYSREWSARIMLEASLFPKDECWFVTCTYNDDQLNLSDLVEVFDDRDDGSYLLDQNDEIVKRHKSSFFSLSKKQHQDFLKRLRKHYGKLRFFGCGEYGSVSYRPHMHYIFFGLKLDDLEHYKVTSLGDILYTSKTLESIWQHGFVIVGRCTVESAAYVARYTIKKRNVTDKSVYSKLGIEPEFVVMSRKPGIGANAFDVSIYDTDEVILPGRNGSVSLMPPSYYDSLLEKADPVRYELIKESRRLNASLTDDFLNYQNPLLDKASRLEARERSLKSSISVLKRGDF